MNLFLEPIDVWLFRDGRPFDAGSDHRAQSLFPPPPSVIQGALRSHHLVIKGVDLEDKQAIKEAVGDATHYPPGFRIRGPFIARYAQDVLTLYLPLPADAIKEKDRFLALRPQQPPAGLWANVPTPLCWLLPDRVLEKFEEAVWVSLSSLILYLENGELGTDKAVSADSLYERESRLGIRLQAETRTTEEGALYEVEFIRPKPDIGLLIEVHGLEGWPPVGLMRFGGEGHGARFRQLQAPPWPSPPDPLPERFKVYFATPAYFKGGWLPQDWGNFFTGSVKLKAVALSRYLAIGGFDLAKGEHKSVRRYVPAGSVYFFEAEGEARLKPDLVNQAITEEGAEIGYGQILIGRW
jgi:CRISPR-associated protein Cmr3